MSAIVIICLISLSVGSSLSDGVNLDTRVNELEKLVALQYRENQALKARAVQLEEKYNQLKDLKCDEKGSMADFDPRSNATDMLRNIQKRFAPRQQRAVNHVAFHAYQSQTVTYYPHEKIKFDTEVVDEPYQSDLRSGYSPKEGIFDAPVTGVYVFTWTVTAPHTAEPFITELIIDGQPVTSTMCDPDYTINASGNGVHPSTGVYVARVNEGIHVSVRMSPTGRAGTVKSDSDVRSTFSGWLLF